MEKKQWSILRDSKKEVNCKPETEIEDFFIISANMIPFHICFLKRYVLAPIYSKLNSYDDDHILRRQRIHFILKPNSNRPSEINSFHSMILLPLKYNPGKLKVLYTIF